jgi:acetyl/propionyl-CoA carboxylase alpha subunit
MALHQSCHSRCAVDRLQRPWFHRHEHQFQLQRHRLGGHGQDHHLGLRHRLHAGAVDRGSELEDDGTVGTVAVKAGDQVKAGQVLMTMAPESVSTAQLQAQATRSSSLKH